MDDDSEEYGDFDETEILAIATQIERGDTVPFEQSPRPQKRRRLDESDQPNGNPDSQVIASKSARRNTRRGPFPDSSQEEDDNDLRPSSRGASSAARARKTVPSTTSRPNSRAKENHGESPAKKPGHRKQDRIFIPTVVDNAEDIYSTQLPDAPSPPGRMRGAIWQKPTSKSGTSIGVFRQPRQSQAKTMIPNFSRQPPPNRDQEQAQYQTGGTATDIPAAQGTCDFNIAQELADLPSDAFSSSSPQKENDPIILSERSTRLVAPTTGLRQTTLFGREGAEPVPPSQANKRFNFVAPEREEPPTHHKLDKEALQTWVYPTNLGTIRDYQFNIVARGLFHNLLVALPTGLGKTFIAATIMLNWFRWTKDAQIVFLAPTKPLVSQQIEACFNIVGIPRSYTSMLTGNVAPGLRAEEWASKRVFFMTPQTFSNDLKTGICDPKRIVLLVVDEAHKATGSYAYVEVVKFIRRFNESFRVLALTATPGSDVDKVQEVIDGLEISKIEIRTEQSLDIRNYIHSRTVEKKIFDFSDEIQHCMDLYSQAVKPLLSRVRGQNASWTDDPTALTPYGCTMMRQQWMRESGRHANQGVKFMVNNSLTMLGSLSQSMELLKYHGIRPFYIKLRDFKEESAQSKAKSKREIIDSDAFTKLMNCLRTWTQQSDFTGHPKLDSLQEIILDHFVNAQEGRGPDGAPPSHTRIMVFAHFRDSAEDIVRVLKRHEPMIRPHIFNGQAHAKNSEGMDQKKQIDIIEKFKSGTYNTLVATSIGEEGLDIGEVDLIICYDSKASPIRMLQRMGRTGRKRQGRIVLFQMRGKEERDANIAKDSYEKMQELVASGSRFSFHDERSRRIVPKEIQPVVDKRVVEIPLENSQADLPEPTKRGRAPKRPPKKFHMPDGVLTGFVSAARMDEELAPKGRGRKKAIVVYPSEELVIEEPLESVLLNEKETRDLERRFQTVFDDEESPMIDALDFGKFPDRQRVFSKTRHMRRHGQRTRAFVHTLQRIHVMAYGQLERFEKNVSHSDIEAYPDDGFIISESSEPEEEVEDAAPRALEAAPKARAKLGPKPRAKPAAAPRRPPDNTAQHKITPSRQTYRVSDLVAEGASSSPPPTDPRLRLPSQAESLGSQDTVRSYDAPQDTQAYRLDSDLRSFIADDDEEVGLAPSSSLPVLDLGSSFTGLGKGTQAVVNAGKQRNKQRMEKIFTSDTSDNDGVVSSDSGESIFNDGPAKRLVVVVGSDTEDEEPVRPVKRRRRVVDDDEDE